MSSAGDDWTNIHPPSGDPTARSRVQWPPALDLRELAATEPSPPAFIVSDWLPAGYATLIGGHGGSGKSQIVTGLGVCLASGLPWCGMSVARRRVLYLSCEDRAAVIHWRLARICQHLGIDLTELHGWLHIHDLVGEETILWPDTPDGQVTAAYEELADLMASIDAEVLIIDGVADVYAGNENDRAAVKAFVNRLVRLIDPDRGAVLLIAHVNKQAASTARTTEGYSGSTGWHNAVRARWYLRPEGDEEDRDEEDAAGSGGLILDLQKSNLGPAGRSIPFHWNGEAHLLVDTAPETGTVAAIREKVERNSILEAMADVAARGDYCPAATTGPRTAYQVLSATKKLASGLTGSGASRRRFWRRIEDLRQMGEIQESSIRRANRHVTPTLELVSLEATEMRRCAE